MKKMDREKRKIISTGKLFGLDVGQLFIYIFIFFCVVNSQEEEAHTHFLGHLDENYFGIVNLIYGNRWNNTHQNWTGKWKKQRERWKRTKTEPASQWTVFTRDKFLVGSKVSVCALGAGTVLKKQLLERKNAHSTAQIIKTLN